MSYGLMHNQPGNRQSAATVTPETICSLAQLADYFPEWSFASVPIPANYPLKVPRYYLSLIKTPEDPLWRQAIPDLKELSPGYLGSDPLGEAAQSPVPGLIHRYPDRVVFLASTSCAMYCRHCMRRRSVGSQPENPMALRAAAIDYIRRQRHIREVILSGGDPFMLSDQSLEDLLKKLRAIDHVTLLRIHTRIPCTCPGRVTPRLVAILKRFHPLFINIQFNHPDEITLESTEACRLLADAGIPLGNQSVLLKNVNDDAATMERLLLALLSIRVRPYYLHHPDLVTGTSHFQVPLRTGLAIMRALRGRVSGIAIPQYMLDLPGGGGKIPLLPQYIEEEMKDRLVVKNFAGKRYEYFLD